MEGVSLGLSLVATVDICLKYSFQLIDKTTLIRFRYGKLLVERYKAYRNANDRLSELVLRVTAIWIKTEIQAEMLRDLGATREERLQSLQHAMLLQLQAKLQMAISEVDRVLEEKLEGKVPAMNLNMDKLLVKKYKSVRLEKLLNHTISELEGSQQRFDPTWFFITRVTNPRVDQGLTEKSSCKLNAVSLVKAIRSILQTSVSHVSDDESIFLDEDYTQK